MFRDIIRQVLLGAAYYLGQTLAAELDDIRRRRRARRKVAAMTRDVMGGDDGSRS